MGCALTPAGGTLFEMKIALDPDDMPLRLAAHQSVADADGVAASGCARRDHHVPHVVAFFLLLAVVVAHHYRLGASGVFGLGVGITAYTLGLHHAFDADHIAAIDNTTRKLMNEGQRPLSVGFFFSLGHSTLVFALGVLVTVGVRGLSGSRTTIRPSTRPPASSGLWSRARSCTT